MPKTTVVTGPQFILRNKLVGYSLLSCWILSLLAIVLTSVALLTPTSKPLVITSIALSILCLIAWIVAFLPYYSVFRFQFPSAGLYLFLITLILILVVLGVDMYLFVRKPQCPSGQEYSDLYSHCVDKCDPYEKIDPTHYTCVQGCDAEHPCPKGEACVSTQCCPDPTDFDCHGTCCAKGSDCDSQGCCPPHKKCGKKCCGNIGECDPSTNRCGIYCPFPDGKGDTGYVCPPGMACAEISINDPQYQDIINYYPNAHTRGETGYVCVGITASCQPGAQPQFFPGPLPMNGGGQFYPVYGMPSDNVQEILTGSMQDFEDSQWKTLVSGAAPNKDHAGAYCGSLANPTRFVQYELEGNTCGYQDCLRNAFPDITTNVGMEQEGNTTRCNYRLDMTLFTNNAPSSLRSYNLHYYDPITNKEVLESKDFKGDTSGLQPQTGFMRNADAITTFQSRCSSFPSCPVDTSKYTCDGDAVGWIDDNSGKIKQIRTGNEYDYYGKLISIFSEDRVGIWRSNNLNAESYCEIDGYACGSDVVNCPNPRLYFYKVRKPDNPDDKDSVWYIMNIGDNIQDADYIAVFLSFDGFTRMFPVNFNHNDSNFCSTDGCTTQDYVNNSNVFQIVFDEMNKQHFKLKKAAGDDKDKYIGIDLSSTASNCLCTGITDTGRYIPYALTEETNIGTKKSITFGISG